jgi:integrase
VRPNASENSQINPSTIVRVAQDDGSRPNLASILQEGRKSANIQVRSAAIWGIPANGRPMSALALSALVMRAVQAAGLPQECVPHGLRKSAMRRLAEHGSTSKEIASVSGHRSLKEIERYTAAADQAQLARSAVVRIPQEQNSK